MIVFCGDHSADCGCFKPEIQYPEERLKRVPLGLMAIAWALSVYTGYHGDPLAKSTHTAKVLTGQLGWYQVVVSILSFHSQLLAFTGHSIPTTSENFHNYANHCYIMQILPQCSYALP